MSHVSLGKVHFIFGIISLVIILVVGMLLKLSTIGEGIIGIVFVLVMTPVLYLWISKAKKHDHGYSDSVFKNSWLKKHEHSES